MFGKETLQFEEVVQDIISHVKMNKSSSDDMDVKGLLLKGSMIIKVDPRRELASPTTAEYQNSGAVKM